MPQSSSSLSSSSSPSSSILFSDTIRSEPNLCQSLSNSIRNVLYLIESDLNYERKLFDLYLILGVSQASY
uniref:Uncharacterized protein n=1 Tax=Noccaea caerulescens TaxID=107243 RepID=A0A1J3CN84_NOCCA